MQILEPSPKTVGGFASELRSGEVIAQRDHGEDPRWKLAQRIAASGILGRSRLLADFLLYIVDRSICDRTDEITEQQIGVLVFGRTEGYDSNDDNIVRSYARNLRKRIDEYFATEGKEETLCLEIPRGGYAPIFTPRVLEVETSIGEAADPDAESSPVSLGSEDSSVEVEADNLWSRQNSKRVLGRYGVGLALCLGIVLGVGGSLLRSARGPAFSSEEGSEALWRQIFNGERDTFIVPSDDGLVIMQEISERPVPLASYVSGSYRTNVKTDDVPASREILKLGGRRYTSVADLDFVAHLARLKEVVPGRMMIRYARDLRMDDLHTGNAVLIGSDEANPWIELFEPQLNFRFRFNPGVDKQPVIANLHPRPGESAVYSHIGEENTYGLIAYRPNLDSTGHVLLIGGLNMAGTQAAGALVLNPALMAPVLERARGANGSLQPFELLIGASNVAANASTPHIVLERIGLP
ncbi:hypothetical protein [Granulicella sp. dw_53]|uniref:hypothetical protein n=1 Tax=Granulicella sp. dw_53 TaxID=2719792 RepID=UPI001BD2454F|nr:hypothetical protein [Granulicella sp. dw_53]